MIRKAGYEDLDKMADLLNELFSIEEDFSIDKQKQLKGLELLLESNTANILVYEADGKVKGMVTAQILVSTAEGALSGLIEDMVITKDSRGSGLGTKLLDSIINWCYEKGCVRVQLLADKTNLQALKFYDKNNFSRTNMICLKKS